MITRALLFLTVFFLVSCAALIQPNIKSGIAEIKQGNYELDKSHATVLFKVNHMGFSKFIGRFNTFDAGLTFDPDNFANSKLNAIVDMSSIDVNSPDFEETLRGKDWLNTDEFPQAIFESESAKQISESKAVFSGYLTFLGVRGPVDIEVIFNGGANNILTQKYTLGFEAKALFSRSAFGLDRYVPTIGDDIELEVHVEFHRK
ncbi:YceI family protein [Teredinibacter sp. KSP-S5-2]|uniref:YceI family protein n=1 Tax=Teredinibacter sp. KSP-S5-2 TaxID=3034506 RepID=UPI00293493D4|nr:YceI family protein [Teredinibacter sp. KSP-S5-2]WNO11616.1 YceI family protein [Teredinibacter sp. KSP-S5-2]